MIVLELPAWEEARARVANGHCGEEPGPDQLDIFVYEFEPSNNDLADAWRAHLAAVLDEIMKKVNDK